MAIVEDRRPDKIQGTDGVRGIVLSSSNKRIKGLHPLQAYINEGVITEEFSFLYGYCLGKFLKRKKLLSEKDSVVVGWDPRDKDGFINSSFIEGLSRSCWKIVIAGTVPTPAAVIFMQYIGACCAAVLTASHNPPDQNGIKIFLSPLGMKLLPVDEIEFTKMLFDINLYKAKKEKKVAEIIEMQSDAVECFKEFMIDPRNHLIPNGYDKSNFHILLDSANGGYSGIAKDVFKKVGFGDVVETAGDLKENVNDGCGVTMVEGKSVWELSDKSHMSPIIEKMMRILSQKKNRLNEKKDILTGLVFDADGDRFIRLEADLRDRKIDILDGDKTASLVANFMSYQWEGVSNPLIINTIESDAGTGEFAESLGFNNKVTGVGDRWILFYLIMGLIEEIIKNNRRLGLSISGLKELKSLYSSLKKGENLSAVEISRTFESINLFKNKNMSTKIGELLLNRKIDLGIAYEASGHIITVGFLNRNDGALLPVFTGNGMKSALNSLAADIFFLNKFGKKKRDNLLRKPFNESYKKSFYVYYSDRKKFAEDEKLRRNLKKDIKYAVYEIFGNKFLIREEKKKEETELLYLNIFDEEKNYCATVYIRNSGTEEKTQVTVKSLKNYSKKIEKVGKKITNLLRLKIKNEANPFAKIQKKILRMLSAVGEYSKKGAILLFEPDEQKYFPRILDETMRKEKLIKESKMGKLSLTEEGKNYCSDKNFFTGTIPVILAAGKGTRMKSSIPKVLHKLAGKSMLRYSLDVTSSCDMFPSIVVVGYKSSLVIKETGREGIIYVLQKKQLGTGHAVMQVEEILKNYDGDILILYGDIPLLKAGTIRDFVSFHKKNKSTISILTTEMDEPFGYGRIVRDKKGDFLKIVEEKDASNEEKDIKEINSGIYCVKAKKLFSSLRKINNDNAQGEFYLTDVAEIFKLSGEKINIYKIEDSLEVKGINSIKELKEAEIIAKDKGYI